MAIVRKGPAFTTRCSTFAARYKDHEAHALLAEGAALVDELEDALAEAQDQLERQSVLVADHARRINRSAQVEQFLFDVARGKSDLPTREECRSIALRLGDPSSSPLVVPVAVLLFCPVCKGQHIDSPDSRQLHPNECDEEKWENPPHRSHLCNHCGCIWRAADVPTTGVSAVSTHGKADTWQPAAAAGSDSHG